ncbi:SafA/ExsA family spore coat assembly protein [uncultured Metabacillus sp.]|uniref:SafA/ExsA family spore coat assembly protein n=1 Tax=uncultured Metabacillus sp. TaxID=2860135 RepID=UPI00261C8ACA|nr:SafA/ExsA family spore coat assembly protein [uncultured Metabacillus sp.]
MGLFSFPQNVFGQTTTHTVRSGDTLWLISQRYQVGLSEIINANPQFKNPNLIYPGQKVNIPQISGTKSIEQQVISLTNAERQKAGLPPLRGNWELSRVARYKSVDMRDRNYFSHTSPTYGSPFTMMKNFGISYRTAAENIAAGQRTPEAVVKAWMQSPGHRANILKRDVTEIGVGYAKGGSYGHYWTQMFIGR